MRIFPLQVVGMQCCSKCIFPKIRQPKKCRYANTPHTSNYSTFLCIKSIGKYPFMSHKMEFFIFFWIICFLEHCYIVGSTFMQVFILITVYGINLKPYIPEISACKFTCFTYISYITHASAFTSKHKYFFNS